MCCIAFVWFFLSGEVVFQEQPIGIFNYEQIILAIYNDYAKY